MSEKNPISLHLQAYSASRSKSYSREPKTYFNTTESGDMNEMARDGARRSMVCRFPAAGAFIVAASMLTGCSAYSYDRSGLMSNALFSADHTSKRAISNNSHLISESYQLAHLSEKTSSGSILIARPAPQINVMYASAGSSDLSRSEPRMLGFAPTSANEKGLISHTPVATINRKASTVAISGLDEPGIVRQISDSIPAGAYKVGLIQQNPRWYAPDSYYTRRKLSVPPAGSAPRFLKGALGIGAIFLQPLNALNSLLQIPLHCAREFSEDVGGVQLHEDTYLELQRALKLGNTVVIE